jgi:hypothetical protein
MEQTICSCKYCCKAKERHQFESVLLVPASTGYAPYAIILFLLLFYLMLSAANGTEQESHHGQDAAWIQDEYVPQTQSILTVHGGEQVQPEPFRQTYP